MKIVFLMKTNISGPYWHDTKPTDIFHVHKLDNDVKSHLVQMRGKFIIIYTLLKTQRFAVIKSLICPWGLKITSKIVLSQWKKSWLQTNWQWIFIYLCWLFYLLKVVFCFVVYIWKCLSDYLQCNYILKFCQTTLNIWG